MNKTAIKNFAVWARRKLISEITYKAGLIGINEKGILQPLPISTGNIQFFDIGTGKPNEIADHEIKQRNALIKRIREKESTSDYKTAFQFVIEEVAYTWFNRLIAIRFMEVNDYLPSRIRVLSSETPAKSEPDMVTAPFDTDMVFSPYETDQIMRLKHENKLDELFRMLFIKQCNKLNEVLPELFEQTADYTELLLTLSFTDSDGIVSHLVNDITEEDFTEAVEIIGWMYQYYNEERKNEVINIYKGTVRKEDIPAATQLFTTDWVVRYMVDNSLGRYWIERNPQSKLQEKLEFFVTPKNGQIQYLDEKIIPEDLTFFDPCMGSGHILVYAFDVLMEIYRESGYVDRDAAKAIVENNLFGLDIDNRAYQLAYFAMMMKARSYDRRFLTREIEPNVSTIIETNTIAKFTCEGVTNDKEQNEIGEYLISAYKDAKEIGSLLPVEKYDFKAFTEYLNSLTLSGQLTLESDYWVEGTLPEMKKIVKQAVMMSDKYAVVCTNPPYMNKLEGQLKKFVFEEYKPYKGDLFSVFMYKNFDYCKPDGYSAFMTPFVWMFIKTYEQLRQFIIEKKSITTLIQMEYSAFEEATVPICSFVLKNGMEVDKGLYIKLSEFRGGMDIQKKRVLEALANKDCAYYYETSKENFLQIPSSPIAFWLSDKLFSIFTDNGRLGDCYNARVGLMTSDNDKFLRYFWEVSFDNICLNAKNRLDTVTSEKKWYPHNKGGAYRKWAGNYEYVVDWQNNGENIKQMVIEKYPYLNGNPNFVVHDDGYYFQEFVSWSEITSSSIAFRKYPQGFTFNVKGMSVFANTDWTLNSLLAFGNSKLASFISDAINPTISFGINNFNNFPSIIINDEIVENAVEELVEMSRTDWDSFETSWNFTTHPLVKIRFTKDTNQTLNIIFDIWKNLTMNVFNRTKFLEEKINETFIELYDLQDELDPKVNDNEITVTKIIDKKEKDNQYNNFLMDKRECVKTLISYSVGCIFGRYSLDVEGLAYAGGTWDENKYKTFVPDNDNCILITDEEYFGDDIVGRFAEFIKSVYGADNFEGNLDFIAQALGNKGNTSKEIIRNYFVKDFYKDHLKTYQKRPIYWLYDSGKQNGFKALVYMHRYSADTTGIVRVDYLHKIQKIYMSEIDRMKDMAENSNNTREIAQAEKRKEKLVKQLKETKEYDEKIAHLAISRIAIDLDDGVKANYEKIQTGQDGKNLDILGKI